MLGGVLGAGVTVVTGLFRLVNSTPARVITRAPQIRASNAIRTAAGPCCRGCWIVTTVGEGAAAV